MSLLGIRRLQPLFELFVDVGSILDRISLYEAGRWRPFVLVSGSFGCLLFFALLGK